VKFDQVFVAIADDNARDVGVGAQRRGHAKGREGLVAVWFLCGVDGRW
jgi:hypothetical protein